MKNETLFGAIENGIAENISRQQITRKLNPLECERQRARQRLGQRRFADARNIFDQKMAAREQAGDRELYRLILAYNDFTNLPRERLNVIGHSGMICGNNPFRKQDVREFSFRLVTSARAFGTC